MATGGAPYLHVGSYPLGIGRWGQADLAGSLYEWTLDVYDALYFRGAGGLRLDDANLKSGRHRVIRGGDFGGSAEYLRSTNRLGSAPSIHYNGLGLRCARSR